MESRTLHRVRGLKFADTIISMWKKRSHPSQGAWIEIYVNGCQRGRYTSHPSQGAWIEISLLQSNRRHRNVAPFTGCVD